MVLELVKALPVSLRSVGLDERWLQDQIQADPAILGLGDLEIAGREHRQPVGGRIDFLMRAIEADTYYEVEVMLGSLDESHIIRTIEYWDIERQRRPTSEHRAVIVAEQITARFFNVIRLLNRAVPLIAIKLSAFQSVDKSKIILHPITVLDVIEEAADNYFVDVTEKSDRAYWDKKSPTSLVVLEKVCDMMRQLDTEPIVTYNRHHIALRSSGRNFCWLHPRKQGRCFVEFQVGKDGRDMLISTLQNGGLEASPRGEKFLAFGVTLPEQTDRFELIKVVLEQAELASR